MTNETGKRKATPSIRVKGAKSASGSIWVAVRRGKKRVWIRQSQFMTDPQGVRRSLAYAGITVIGTPSWNAFTAQVEQLSKFPTRPLLERPGWNEQYFALPSGEVFAPQGTKGVCVFEPDFRKCAQSGTLEGWLSRVAEPLACQSLAMFMIMVMFVAPLLRLTNRAGNFGFELVGEGGKGKSMLLKLMASVIGGAVDSAPSRYWNTCKTTLNALEKKAEAHSDLPLLLDDATSFAGNEGAGTRGQAYKQLVFDLSQGETKDRLDGKKQRWFRLIYCLTSNLSLADVIAQVPDAERGATQDRLLTLSTEILPYNTLDQLPDGYEDIRRYADDLIQGMAAEHGTAMPHFLRALVDHRAKDEKRLKDGIIERVEAFITKTRVDRNDGSPARVAEAFGLVVAAGQLAQYYGALPQSVDCQEAGLATYRLHLASAERLSAKERLLAYAADPHVIDMDEERVKFLTREQLSVIPGVYRSKRNGEREFLITASAFESAFPDHKSMLRDPQIATMRQGDDRHRGPKREIVKGQAHERFYCFIGLGRQGAPRGTGKASTTTLGN